MPIETPFATSLSRPWDYLVIPPGHPQGPPLPKPTPSKAFGFSKDVFSCSQQGALWHFVPEYTQNNYLKPDGHLIHPFLSIECTSQSISGTHYEATIHAATVGAIALNGIIELYKRSRVRGLSVETPCFFSITVDQQVARFNLHWLMFDSLDPNSEFSFQMEMLSSYLLDHPDGVRGARRAFLNILEYARDTLLPLYQHELDIYIERRKSEQGDDN